MSGIAIAPPARAPRRRFRLFSLLTILVLLLGLGLSACNQTDEAEGEETEVAEGASGESENQESGEADAAEDGEAEDSDGEESEADAAAERRKRKERPVKVNVCEVARGELVVPVVAEGTIRARSSADLRFEISGRIEKILVKEGASVRKGQLLARLDGREYRIRIDEAHSRYLQSLGQVAVEEEEGRLGPPGNSTLRDELEQLSAMESRGEITRQERLEREIQLGMQAVSEGGFRRELVEARSGLSTARADEDQARLNLERTEIRAPFTGVISGLTLAQGEWVSASQGLCTLVDNVEIEAEVGVLESDLGSLEVGRPALLAVPALGDTLRLQVDVISPTIDSESRTCRVLLRLRSEDGRVKPGMFVRAFIAGEVHKDRLLVPREAILTRDGRPLLFKLEGDKAKWVYVRLGERNDHLVEIESVLQGGPLDPGTRVVVSDHLTLAHDAKIEVKKLVPMPDAWASFQRES